MNKAIRRKNDEENQDDEDIIEDQWENISHLSRKPLSGKGSQLSSRSGRISNSYEPKFGRHTKLGDVPEDDEDMKLSPATRKNPEARKSIWDGQMGDPREIQIHRIEIAKSAIKLQATDKEKSSSSDEENKKSDDDKNKDDTDFFNSKSPKEKHKQEEDLKPGE